MHILLSKMVDINVLECDTGTLCMFFFRGLPAPEAEMLYMQEVEKMEGYGQESYQAKVRGKKII